MAITPTNNILEIPPTEPKTADAYWLRNLTINAPSLTDKAEVLATLVPYNSTTGEMFPDRAVTLVIDDVLTKAATDMQLTNCCNVIFAEIERQSKIQGLI